MPLNQKHVELRCVRTFALSVDVLIQKSFLPLNLDVFQGQALSACGSVNQLPELQTTIRHIRNASCFIVALSSHDYSLR
jgi:hypothetical protein